MVSTLASGLVGTAAGGSFDDGVVAAAAGYNTAVYNRLKTREEFTEFVKGLAFGVGLELSGADLWLAVGQLTLNLMKQQSEPQQRVPAPAEPQQELSFAGIAEGMLTAPAKDYQEYLRLIRLGGKENAFRAGQIAGSYSIRIGGLLTGVGIGKAILTKGGERLAREGVENAAHSAARGSASLVKAEIQFSKHSLERMAQRGITQSMVKLAISKGQKFYDPLNKSINYVLPNGFASSKSLLVGINPLTKKVTTVIRSSKKLINSRFIPIQ